ncbi:Imm10 family immunity protein [Streptosporangium sp. NBC_01639]|uniref:Imm10 family immunity protein n=1 Tax=Streptosporangium sp. NBC_01639 TaxID=2975948 RepID=UPI0038704D46|nr:Imm10 family immunity protein [Streptosporangium sp. NBC_01639]
MSSDRTHELCIEIGRAVKADAPDGWQEVDVRRCQLGTFSTTVITYQMADGSRQIRPVEGLDGLFHQLKMAEYKPDEGTWFVCRLDYSPRGKSYNSMMHTFVAESPFAQDIEVPASAYMEELTMFPRKPSLTPPWMRAAWPEDVPLPEVSSAPAPPVDRAPGPVWPPLGTMVVRTVGRDDDSETIVFGMAEHEDGTGNALIFMMSTETPDEQETGPDLDTYCVLREDQAGTTYGGVTHGEIAAGRLMLHFTEEAAKELNVEPIVRVDLQIDDKDVDLLRSSLREILLSGRHNQHPHRMRL